MAVVHPALRRAAATEADDPRQRVRRRRRRVGSAVTEFAVGDEVFGVNADRFGAHAEYVCVRERAPIAPKPSGTSFEEAAARVRRRDPRHDLPGVGEAPRRTAHPRLRSVRVDRHGRRPAGQARRRRRHRGLQHAPTSRSWRSLGADEVIDYTIEDFATNGLTYDIVLDAVGKKSFAECKGSLEVGGSYVSTDLGPHSQNVPLMVWTRFIGKKKAMMPIPRYTKDKVERIKELIETGAYRAVIDRTYPLDDAAEATRYVETRAEDRQHRAHRQVSVTSPAAVHGGSHRRSTDRRGPAAHAPGRQFAPAGVVGQG